MPNHYLARIVASDVSDSLARDHCENGHLTFDDVVSVNTQLASYRITSLPINFITQVRNEYDAINDSITHALRNADTDHSKPYPFYSTQPKPRRRGN